MNPSLALPRGPVRAVALVLHGGQSVSVAPVRRRQLAVLRMLPFARALRRAGRAEGLAVGRLRFAVRGWNGEARSPVADARTALDALADRFPGAPIAVVGHSMGGRTALYVAAHPAVRVVVALAPWIEPEDLPATLPGLAGRRLVIAHGDRDRMTSPAASAEYARAAGDVAEAVSYVSVRGDGHAMLRRARRWHRLTTEAVLEGTAACSPPGTGYRNTTKMPLRDGGRT